MPNGTNNEKQQSELDAPIWSVIDPESGVLTINNTYAEAFAFRESRSYEATHGYMTIVTNAVALRDAKARAEYAANTATV